MGFGPACCLRAACQQDLIFKIHLQTCSRLPGLFANISGPLGAQPSLGVVQLGSRNHIPVFESVHGQWPRPLSQLKEMEGDKS